MRFATIHTAVGPTAALFRDGHYVELPGQSVRDLLGRGSFAGIREGASHPAESVRLLPPVPDAPKVLCIGLNYRDHALETGAAIPREPVVFNKFPTALIAHGDAIVLPPVSQKVDFEAELVLVIGRGGRNIARANALDHLAGCMVGHDVSARDWQRKDGDQWLLGKTFDTFAPTGPHLVTLDEVGDPHDLRIQLRINGQTMQDSRTNQLIFRADELIEYVSKVVTLQPGDLIFTGTPPGVGAARKPPVWLKPGDTVEVEIEKLGVLSNPVVAG
jgi:2-keto-4-pentenoate hydratase/2-oxohepta-3-ene-1,7-dioic acid hydratase in catechol pathway